MPDTPEDHRCAYELTHIPPQVLAYAVFGTVVDWRGGIVREVKVLRPRLDAIDDLHRMILDLADQLGCP